jgi:hypothetical protein
MGGKHRMKRKPRHTWARSRPPRRVVLSGAFAVGVLAVVGVVTASDFSVPHAQAEPARAKPTMRIQPVPTVSLPVVTAPKETGEEHPLLTTPPVEKFLSDVAAAGIKTTGREDSLMDIAKRGAESHTTDADLKQSVRALFPDITDVQADKFVLAVRRAFPGDHDVDTDDDGR